MQDSSRSRLKDNTFRFFGAALAPSMLEDLKIYSVYMYILHIPSVQNRVVDALGPLQVVDYRGKRLC